MNSTVNGLNPEPSCKWKVAVVLALLTLVALAVHGYHPYAEDAEIYLPGVEKILHPNLFPVGTEFFESHASLTLFPHLIAASVRITHLPFDYALFAWQVAAIFLLLLAVWSLSGLCFNSAVARWGAVAFMAALLTLPVAGTALYVMDQYLNPRNLAAFSGLFAVSRILERRYVPAALWIAFAAACHPLMAAFAFSFCVLLVIFEKYEEQVPVFALVFPLAELFAPSSPAYHEAIRFHGFHYITNWQWYEWVGILAPVPIFWWMARVAEPRDLRNLARICRALMLYDLVYFAAALVVDIPKQFEVLARIQPLRSLHLLYMILIVIGGGFLAEYVLKDRVWRWIVLFVPLCFGMFFAQRVLFRAVLTLNGRGPSRETNGGGRFSGFGKTPRRMRSSRLIPSTSQLPAKIRLVSAPSPSAAVLRMPTKIAARFQCSLRWLKNGGSNIKHRKTGINLRKQIS